MVDALFVDVMTSPLRSDVDAARRAGILVSNLADYVLANAPIPAVGVTGSAGKSTTAVLIHAILEGAAIPAYIGRANIAENAFPNYEILRCLEAMKESGWLVTELTSSHLEFMHSSPEVAVITNLWPDHLEWHGSFRKYVDAKLNIVRFQRENDVAVIPADGLAAECFAQECRGRVMTFSVERALEEGIFVENGSIVVRWDGIERELMKEECIPKGIYSENVLAACGGAIAVGVPLECARASVMSMQGLDGRRSAFAMSSGATVVNDWMAITPGKARASLLARENEKIAVWVAGGDCESEWSTRLCSVADEVELLKECCRIAATWVDTVILFGPGGDVIRAELEAVGVSSSRIREANSVRDAVRTALETAAENDTILIAPIYYVSPREGERLSAALGKGTP